MRYVIFLLYVFTNVALGCNNTVLDVNSTDGISAKLLLKENDSLSVSVLDDGKVVGTEYIDISSEKKNHITFEDYNRDGYKDFSVWHLDEGMGTYKIYRVFIFTPTEKKFKEVRPTCGDNFVNIRIDGENLINVFYDGNVPKSCAMPLGTFK